MADRNLRPMGDPHQTSAWQKLMGLFRRNERPAAMAALDDDGDEDLQMVKLSDWFREQFNMTANRAKRYEIYREMDMFGLVSGLLDAFAEEATLRDYDKGRVVWIESAQKHLITEGDRCLRNLQAEDRLTPITRRMCKLGDAPMRLIYQSGQGVLGWKTVVPDEWERIEDKYSRLVGFKEKGQKFRGDLKRPVSWPWDYIHFRLLGDDEEGLYGTSLLRALFRPWRQLAMAEDATLMYRLLRAPDRNLVMVDVGALEEHEATDYVNRFRKAMRKHEYIDPASPNYRKQYNPFTPLEDVFLPIRGADSATRIEQLSGSGNVGEIYDVDHFVNMFFGSAGAPKAYFGFEGDINAKASLQQQDVRFARKCKRIQRSTIQGVRAATDIHFTLLRGADGSDDKYDVSKPENAYVVQMSPISFLDEWERLELIQLRYQIVESMARLAQDIGFDARVWTTYVLLNYAKLPEDLVLRLISKMPTGDESAYEHVEKMRAMEANLGRQLNEDEVDQIFDPKGKQREGFWEVNEKEQKVIAEAIHKSPALRKCIANFAEYGEECQLTEAAQAQADQSLLPVVGKDGTELTDDFSQDEHARQLAEDLEAIAGEAKDEEADD